MDQVGLDHFPFYVVAGGGRSVGGVVRGGKSPRGMYLLWAALLPEVALGCCWAVLSVAGRDGRAERLTKGARRRP
jgi:hypothetical protein